MLFQWKATKEVVQVLKLSDTKFSLVHKLQARLIKLKSALVITLITPLKVTWVITSVTHGVEVLLLEFKIMLAPVVQNI